ncbi:MAG: DUF4364 family protein [Oscillospiraceae bacterium]|nr:DUF4364 family protein [Oscillospiraceae bacterium]
MPRYGFSGDEPDMRKLILFILHTVGEAVAEREAVRLALLDDNADYFLFADALTGLIGNSLLTREEAMLQLTPRGREVAAITERGLPAALRRIITDESAAVRDQQLRERCITAEIQEEGAVFSGVLTDGTTPLLEIKLQTGGQKQAAALKKRFEKDAETIMQRIWDAFINP